MWVVVSASVEGSASAGVWVWVVASGWELAEESVSVAVLVERWVVP
jgi:hypothetical protein